MILEHEEVVIAVKLIEQKIDTLTSSIREMREEIKEGTEESRCRRLQCDSLLHSHDKRIDANTMRLEDLEGMINPVKDKVWTGVISGVLLAAYHFLAGHK